MNIPYVHLLRAAQQVSGRNDAAKGTAAVAAVPAAWRIFRVRGVASYARTAAACAAPRVGGARGGSFGDLLHHPPRQWRAARRQEVSVRLAHQQEVRLRSYCLVSWLIMKAVRPRRNASVSSLSDESIICCRGGKVSDEAEPMSPLELIWCLSLNFARLERAINLNTSEQSESCSK